LDTHYFSIRILLINVDKIYTIMHCKAVQLPHLVSQEKPCFLVCVYCRDLLQKGVG